MENGLVTADGTKILTVEEYDRFINAIPKSMKAIFEINTITGLRYIELQRLYENPVPLQKILKLKQNFSFTSKNIKKQNIS